MFKIVNELIVEWPVRVDLGGGGEPVWSEPFQVTYRLIAASEFEKLIRMGDVALLSRVVAGWDGVGDAEGSRLEFSLVNRALLFDVPRMPAALYRGYLEAAAGMREKNLPRRPASGPRAEAAATISPNSSPSPAPLVN